MEVSTKDEKRWELAAMAIRKVDPGLLDGPIPPCHDDSISTSFRGADSFTLRAHNFEWDGIMARSEAVIAIAYGSLHLTVWKWQFPSYAEWLCWIISCFGVLGVLSFTPLIHHAISSAIWTRGRNIMPNPVVRIPVLVSTSFLVAVLVLFLLASRVFLVVEAFISMRRVPIGVYAMVPWQYYVPFL
ncbi:hypothetical protein MFIFM68171_05574 [Madurella fahalii]|uniref:Uncharacterized protein n=1 Tax=Madurella fahalii TaxID=1157608 RepID=A0ABQ0GCA4_9PEZI